MKKVLPIFFLFLIISVVGKAQASSGKMDVYKSLTGKNIDDLYSLGMKYEKTGEKAKALTFYNALVSKYSDDLAKEEKKKCAEAFFPFWRHILQEQTVFFSHEPVLVGLKGE